MALRDWLSRLRGREEPKPEAAPAPPPPVADVAAPAAPEDVLAEAEAEAQGVPKAPADLAAEPSVEAPRAPEPVAYQPPAPPAAAPIAPATPHVEVREPVAPAPPPVAAPEPMAREATSPAPSVAEPAPAAPLPTSPAVAPEPAAREAVAPSPASSFTVPAPAAPSPVPPVAAPTAPPIAAPAAAPPVTPPPVPTPVAAPPIEAPPAAPPAPEPAQRGGWLSRLTGTAPSAPEAPTPEAAPEEPRTSWFGRLKAGLSRTTAKLTDSVTGLFNKRKLDDAALEELEETLITADLGVSASRRIVEGFRRTRFGKEVTDEEVKATLAEEIAQILAPVAQPMPIDASRAPHVVLVVGVNGTGKTTTIAKLGQQYREQGLSCAFVAGDTFRAAAVEQLQIWGDRTGCHVYKPVKDGADAAGLAFDALTQARAEGTQVLLVDTAGRLHNKSALMEELRKIVRVIRRVDESAPHSVLLTLDATTGQNAIQQAKVFKEMVEVTGLAVTKLDGSAKGGVVVALAQEFGLPVHFVGVGEKAADLRPFEAKDFARGLLGLD